MEINLPTNIDTSLIAGTMANSQEIANAMTAIQYVRLQRELRDDIMQHALKITKSTVLPKRYFELPDQAYSGMCFVLPFCENPYDILEAQRLLADVYDVHGQPAISGNLAATALLRKEGIRLVHECDENKDNITIKGWKNGGYVQVNNKDEALTIRRVDIETRQWKDKDGKYVGNLENRMAYRAKADFVRLFYPHVLRGAKIADDLDTFEKAKDVTPQSQQSDTPAISILSKIALPKEVQQPIKPQDIVIDQPKKQDVVQNNQIKDVLVFIRDGEPFSVRRTKHGLANLFLSLQKTENNVKQFLEENAKEDVERIEDLIHTLPEQESIELMRQYTEIFAEKVQATMRGSENETQ